MEEIFLNDHYQFPWDSGRQYLVSEENAELIRSFNETLQKPYPVPCTSNNHVNPYGLIFWTKEDFFFLKNLVAAFPSVMYTLPIIPAAENYADPYCYNTELRNIAVKASFKAQAQASDSSSEPIPYPSIVNRQLVQGSMGDCGIPVGKNYFEGPFLPPPRLTAYTSFGSNGVYHHHDDTFGYNFQMLHTHDCIHRNGSVNHHHDVTPPRDFMISTMPTSTTCTPPKLSDEEILGTSLTQSLEEDVEAEVMELDEDESDNQGKSSDDLKELYGVHIKLGADSRYSTMAGVPHKEYSKYMYGENGLQDGLINGLEDHLSKYELNESQTTLLKNGDLNDDQQSASSVSLKPRKIFLHGKFDFPSFSKDDCADSRSTKSRSRVRRTGSQGRQSLSPSPENTIKKFLLSSPFNGNVECVFCKGNSQTEDVYRSHPIRDKAGVVVCPYLRKYVCLICNATGDAAHTIKYCPFNKRGFFAMRENFPPFNNSNNCYNSAPECGDKEMETSSESTEEYITVSPESSTPNSGSSSSSTLSQKIDHPSSFKLKKLKSKDDFCANDILKEHRCLNIPSHAKLIENSTFVSSSSNCSAKSSTSTSKSSCTMHLYTPVVSTSSGSVANSNGPFYKNMDKVRKSARKLWTSGRSS